MKPTPTLEEILKLEKWGAEYIRIYQRLYQRKRRNIWTQEEIIIFNKMKNIRGSQRPSYTKLKYNKGEKINALNVKHEKIIIEFD